MTSRFTDSRSSPACPEAEEFLAERRRFPIAGAAIGLVAAANVACVVLMLMAQG